MPITKTFDMLNISGVKGWIRDSWSRRKITDLTAAMPTVYRKGTMTATLYAYGYGYSWSTSAFRIFLPLQIASEVSTASLTASGTVKMNGLSSGAWILGSGASTYTDVTAKVTSMTVMPGRGLEIVVQGLTVPQHDAIVGRIQITGLTFA